MCEPADSVIRDAEGAERRTKGAVTTRIITASGPDRVVEEIKSAGGGCTIAFALAGGTATALPGQTCDGAGSHIEQRSGSLELRDGALLVKHEYTLEGSRVKGKSLISSSCLCRRGER